MIVDYKSSAAAAAWNLINAHHTGPGGLAVEAAGAARSEDGF